MTSRPRLLCLVVHYIGDDVAFRGKSTTGDPRLREAVVRKVLDSLAMLPAEAHVKVCGIPDRALVPIDVDLSYIGDPYRLVHATIGYAISHVDDYDEFLIIEDDIVMPADTLERMLRFQLANPVNEVLLPNRMEIGDLGVEYAVDLIGHPGWSEMTREFEGFKLGSAVNPHSGMSLLSAEQLAYAAARIDLAVSTPIVGGPMASAFAQLHEPFLLWRVRDQVGAHQVRHLDAWTAPPMRVAERIGSPVIEPTDALGWIDEVTFDGVACTVRGWAAYADGSPALPEEIRLGGTRVAGCRIQAQWRTEIPDAIPHVSAESGYIATFSLLDLDGLSAASSEMEIVGGGVKAIGPWPRAAAAFELNNVSPVTNDPTLPPEASARLQELWSKSSCYLEYGSGGTTLAAARAGVPLVYAVETDAGWLATVSHRLGETAGSGRQVLLHADLGPVKEWGYPRVMPGDARPGNYVFDVWDRIDVDGTHPDLVLIDGRYRVAAFLGSLLRARPKTTILFDDYLDREAYRVVAEILEPRATYARTAEFVVPRRFDRHRAWQLLARHASEVI